MGRGGGVGRSRWAAFGAAIAVSIGAGGLFSASASLGTGERSTFVPITPCRLFDTRPAPDTVGNRSAPLAASDTHDVLVWGTNGNCTLPTDATGLVLNVAVIGPSDSSFLTVYPTGATRPLAANLNWSANDPPLSNAVTVDVSGDGRISFYNLRGTVNVAADVVGYFVDHHHDDRYFTKAESNAALAGKAAKPAGTGLLVVDPASLRPESKLGGDANYFAGAASAMRVTSGTGCFNAPVFLPHGVTVTSVTAHIDDTNSANDEAFLLLRNPVGAVSDALLMLASMSSPGGPGMNLSVTDSTIEVAVIDNSAYSYVVRTCFTTNYGFHDLVINYTFPA